MSKAFSSCTVDVLHIFGKVMCFFQNIGVVEAYTFSHTSVNFNPNFEKYLEGFISVLEELKLVLDRLYDERNKVLTKAHEYKISSEITGSSNYSVNLQITGNLQNFNTSSQSYSELQTNSVTQNFQKLDIGSSTQNYNELQNNSATHSFTKLKSSSASQNFSELQNNRVVPSFTGLEKHSANQSFMKLDGSSSQHNFTTDLHSNGTTEGFTELQSNSNAYKFQKLHNTSIAQNFTDFKNTLTASNFSTSYKNDSTVQNYSEIPNSSGMQSYGKLQSDTIVSDFNGFKNNSIDGNFSELRNDAMQQKFNDLPVPAPSNVPTSSQIFNKLQNNTNLLTNNCSKVNNSSNNLLVASSGLMTNNNEIELSNNQMITNHNDINNIAFTNSLINDNPPLVTNTDYGINIGNKMTDNQYLDNHNSDLTPGSQLISSAIESLVQDTSDHEAEDDSVIINSEEIAFRSLEVADPNNLNNSDCPADDINNANVWNEQQKSLNSTTIKESDSSKSKTSEKKSYKCHLCDKVLSAKSNLVRHIAAHSGVKPFCCEHCGKLFTLSTNLAAHLTRQHNLNTESANSCPECGKLFVRKSALETHLAGHRGDKRFSCFMCGKKFTQKVTRDTHILSHTRSYPFSCDICQKRFTVKSKLNFHKKKHSEFQYSCTLCDKQFSTKQYLNAHYKTHNIAQSEAAPCCLDTVSENSRTQIIEVSNVGCPQCDMTFKTKRALTRHTKTKHNPITSWYHCTVPDCTRPVKSFATRGLLHKHNQRHHSGSKRKKYSCTTCGKEFFEKYSLLHHVRQNHTAGLTPQQLKPHVCHICQKRYTLKTKLNIHIRRHTQESQFTCDICAEVFTRKDTLKKHKAKQHPTLTNDQPQPAPSITCNRCGKVFKSKNALSYHIQLHDENYQFACSICGKKFVRKCHYDEHVRTIHTTERPLKCPTCGRSFKNKKYWREHLKRVHTNEVTMQSLFDSITSEDALTTQHTMHPMHHVPQMQQPVQTQSMPPLQVQTQTNDCLSVVDVTNSFVLSSATFVEFQASSSVQ